jgi:hypothetical protein
MPHRRSQALFHMGIAKTRSAGSLLPWGPAAAEPFIGPLVPMAGRAATRPATVGRPPDHRGGDGATATSAERAGEHSDRGAWLPSITDLDDLLQRATRRARDLWDADECTLWLRDPARPHVHLSIDGTADRKARMNNAMLPQARYALRVPVHTQTGPVGLVEVVGPREGHFSSSDGERLEAFADDVGAAYDRLLCGERPRRCVMRWWIPILASIVLMAIGLLLILGAAWVLAARALPLSGLPGRPGFWPGSVLTVAGLLLTQARRRRSTVPRAAGSA